LENVAVALSFSLAPTAKLDEGAVTAILATVAEPTLRDLVAVTEPTAAVMVVDPWLAARTRPFFEAKLASEFDEFPTLATAALDELQVAESVTSSVVPSEKVPIAFRATQAPTPERLLTEAGERARLVRSEA